MERMGRTDKSGGKNSAASCTDKDIGQWGMRLLVLRFIHVCRAGGDLACGLACAERRFSRMYKYLFGEANLAPNSVLLFGHSTVNVRDVVDLVILVAANFSLGAEAYGLMYWAVMTLLHVHEASGKRLINAMETHGFVFDTDFSSAAETMRARSRSQEPAAWACIQDYAEQLCELLVQHRHATIAGVYNDVAARCGLPVPSKPKCTADMLANMVRHFEGDPEFGARVRRYAETHAGYGAADSIAVNGDGGDTVLLRQSAAAATVFESVEAAPVFESVESCVQHALACAKSLFLPPGAHLDVAWHARAYRVPHDRMSGRGGRGASGNRRVVASPGAAPSATPTAASSAAPSAAPTAVTRDTPRAASRVYRVQCVGRTSSPFGQNPTRTGTSPNEMFTNDNRTNDPGPKKRHAEQLMHSSKLSAAAAHAAVPSAKFHAASCSAGVQSAKSEQHGGEAHLGHADVARHSARGPKRMPFTTSPPCVAASQAARPPQEWRQAQEPPQDHLQNPLKNPPKNLTKNLTKNPPREWRAPVL